MPLLLERHGARQRDHARLARAVRAQPRRRPLARRRREVDDRAAGLAQQRQRRVHAVDHALQIHIEHEIDVVVRHLFDPAAFADARIVEQHMHAPVRGLTERLHRALPPRAVAHVERHRDALSFGKQGRGVVETLRIHVEQADEPAALGEQLRRRPADARARAGDDRQLCLEPHRASPYFLKGLCSHNSFT